MSKTLRNVLIAAAVAMLVSFLFGALGAAVNSPDLASVGLTLAASIGGITFFILHLRSGNRRVAQADSGTRERALAFSCPPDRALVFFVRSGFAGGAVGVDVDIDGKTIAQIKSPRFTCMQLAPGEHALSAHIGGSASALKPGSAHQSGVLAPGSVTVLRIAIRRGLLKSQLVFEPWTLETAKAKLGKIGMVSPAA